MPDSDALDSTFGVPQPQEAAVLDQFIACFEGLKDSRTGNAGLHDLHELLVETRIATVNTDIKWLQDDHQWPGLPAIAKVPRTRETNTKTTTETAYSLLSAPLLPERCNEVVRCH